MISQLRQRVNKEGKCEINIEEFNQLQAEWIKRTKADILTSASVQGRSEALQIILNLDPEGGIDEYLSASHCGEYESVVWNVEGLKKLFHVGDEYENSPGCKISAAADSLYWENVAKSGDMDTLKGLVSDLLYIIFFQVEAGKIQTGQNCTVDILKTWIK